MSQNQNNVPGPGQPRKFLKKGEGLKRFAAYNPPLPVVASNKLQRRQTFVKFNFISPEILNNKSINLSTEIPKIAPPKIMHTPIRPNRQALGALTGSTFNRDAAGLLPDMTLTRKVTSIEPTSLNKMVSFNGFRKPATPSPLPSPARTPVAQSNQAESHPTITPDHHESPDEAAPRRYNLRGSRKQNPEGAPQKKAPKRGRQQLKAVVERHLSPINIVPDEPNEDEAEFDNVLRKIEEKKTSLGDERTSDEDEDLQRVTPSNTRGVSQRIKHTPTFDLSTPMPGNASHAINKRLQQIEADLNELKRRAKNNESLYTPPPKQTRKSSRKTSRSNDETRPSAYADNSTPKLIKRLIEEFERLKTDKNEEFVE